ncbi:hypothetical protein Y1Q_0019965 [Alligator mississippiensis]|uniref:Uncharacterized protein n=1 Tax=Alligator mississippiensis TaxID=8496 RepID=A0A151PER6_ALLMI|nr:hypothetical protein Y1Q_0019965 [Alligator mississippiensis]
MSAAERLETGESTGPKDSFSKNISCLNDHVEEAANVSTLSIRMDDADKTPLVACSCETILPQHKAHEELQRTEALDSATQGAAQKGFFAETTEAGGKAQINQVHHLSICSLQYQGSMSAAMLSLFSLPGSSVRLGELLLAAPSWLVMPILETFSSYNGLISLVILDAIRGGDSLWTLQ